MKIKTLRIAEVKEAQRVRIISTCQAKTLKLVFQTEPKKAKQLLRSLLKTPKQRRGTEKKKGRLRTQQAPQRRRSNEIPLKELPCLSVLVCQVED